MKPHKLTESDVERIQSALSEVETESIVVRPDKDNSGIPGMDDVLRSLPRATHDTPRLGGKKNTSNPFAFEMRYSKSREQTGQERVLSLEYLSNDSTLSALLERQLSDEYSDSWIETMPADSIDVEEGQYLSAATLGLRRYTLYPMKNAKLDEFRKDPTGSILTEMVGAADAGGVDADVSVQIMVRPAATDWKDGVANGYGLADEYGSGYTSQETKVTKPMSTKELRWHLTQPTVEYEYLLPPFGQMFHGIWWLLIGGDKKESPFIDVFEHDPSEADKQAAKMLSDLDGRGWEFHVRVMAVSDDPDLATERVQSTCAMFDNYYEYRGAQTFLEVPKNGSDAVETVVEAAQRAWPENPDQQMIKPQIEVAGLVNVPEAEHVNTNKLRWSLAKPGDGVPVGTPRFDFDSVGVANDATKEEKQVALLDSSTEGSPFWYGLGVRRGVEAGVFTDIRNPHMFVVGESGVGKTTFLAGKGGQDFPRPGGGLRLDPNGDDTDEWMSEWPEDKPAEDCIYMDLSGDEEKIPRFNFLEIPDYLEEGSRRHTEFLEALAEDILRMVGEAGGTDNYVGGLMKRVVKTVVRSMGRVGENATLFDVAAVCSSQDNLAAFAEAMPEDRFQYLRQRVRSLAERKDSELDPLAGRLDEWVLNPNVRELICARDPSFSIEDAVTEGRQIFVRMSSSGTDIVKHMVGSAMITRTYFAQRFHRPDHPFNLVVDEGQDIITSASDIESIMDQGRKFDYRVTVACQRPESQFPDSVREAILGNAATTIGFSLGSKNEAKAVADQFGNVEASDLTNMSPYRFYLQTETEDNITTNGYLVEAFRAPSEARKMVAELHGEETQSRVGVKELQEKSMEIYGALPNEGDAESPYTEGEFEQESPSESETTNRQEEAQRRLCKAAYDCLLHSEGDSSSVPMDAVRKRLGRYDGGEWTPAQFAQIVTNTPEVTFVETEDENLIEVGEEAFDRFLPVEGNQTEGGLGHWQILRDAYEPLSSLGLEVHIPQQNNRAEVDGVGRIRETFNPDVDPRENPGAYAKEVDAFREEHTELADLTDVADVTLEAESSTSGKPAATLENLKKAVSSGRVCVFLTRPENADKVYGTLTDPPYIHSEPEGYERQFYNRKRLGMSDEWMLRPAGASQTRWYYDGEYVLADSDGVEHARFDSHSDIFTNVEAYPAHASDGEVGDEWTHVRKPWIPEREFDRIPTEEDWRLLVVETDGTVSYYNGPEIGAEPSTVSEPAKEAEPDETAKEAEPAKPSKPAKTDEVTDTDSLWDELDELFEEEAD